MEAKSNRKWIIISYAFASLGTAALTQAFGVRTLDFYENEVKLDGFLIALAWILYGVWNSINDPFAGYISDRHWKFTKRWGKRFPWMIFTIIPFAISYVLIFTPPDTTESLPTFFWFLLTICIFDTAFTIYALNYAAILPDKFRTDEERNKTVAYKYIFSMFGLVLGLLLPPLFITYGNRTTFVVAAIFIMVVSLVPLLIGIPGSRDTPEMIQKSIEEEKLKDQPSFFVTLRQIISAKNSRTFFLVNMCSQTIQVIILASVPYYVRCVLIMEASTETILLGVTLATIVLSIPFWTRIMKTRGSRSVIVGGMLFTAIGLVPLLFSVDFIGSLLSLAIVGIGMGAQLISIEVALTDVIDEDAVQYKHRREGIFYGINGFIIRLSLIFEAIAFTGIHALTDYQEGAIIQPVSAIFGLRMQIGFVPLIFAFIALIYILKSYDLVPAKVETLKKQLKALNL